MDKNHFQHLKEKSLCLEPGSTEMQADGLKTMEYIKRFYQGIYESPSFITKEKGHNKIQENPIQEKGYGFDFTLDLFHHEVNEFGLNAASGGHMGYIPGGGLFHSALGDALAAASNEYAGHFFAGPGAVQVENHFIKWLVDLVNFPANAVGNLTSGGSIANLIGVVCARDAKKIDSTNIRKSVIYSSEHAHHCVHKAIRIAGLSESILREAPLDSDKKIDAQLLDEMIQQDVSQGLNPFLIIANAGTTDFGGIDPLQDLHTVSQKHNCWYHVDAAYGGFFMLTEEGQQKMKGIELADSLVLDPHKGLFIPYGLGAVLIRDIEVLRASHHYQANYMQDTLVADDEISPAEVSPELTKHFRGLRAWLPLMVHGVEPFRYASQEKLDLCKYFYQEISKWEGVELGPAPDLSVCSFHFIPPAGIDANDYNLRICEMIKLDGRVFLSSTLKDDKVFIRFACQSIRTHIEIVDLCLQVLKEKKEEAIKLLQMS